MADKTVAAYDGTTDSGNIQLLVRGTASADVIANGLAVTTSDTLIIDCEFNDDILVIIEEQGSGTAVVTFAAGDNPPSPHAASGSVAVSVPQADCVLFVPQAGRHVHDDGKIRATVSGQTVNVWVFRMAAGFLGQEITNRASIPAAPTD
jgi:hypothetical protein